MKKTAIITVVIVLALGMILLVGKRPPAERTNDQQVAANAAKNRPELFWFWFESCGYKQMMVEVTFDRRTVYHTAVPICKRGRGASQNNEQWRVVSFPFTPKRSIAWTGYLDGNTVSKAGQVFEGNIWQAGVDPDALVLGISFVLRNRIFIYRQHFAPADAPARTTIEPGLVVTTRPVEKAK